MSKSIHRGALLLALALVVPACGGKNNSSGNSGGTPPPGGNPPPTALPAPSNIQTTPGDREITLTWDAVPGATGYVIRSATDQGGPYGLVEMGFTGTLFIDDTLDNGTTYYYVISTLNGSMEGSPSAEVSATPQSSTPPPTQTWTRSAANPVLVGSGNWEVMSVQDPSVVQLGPTSWVMYYTGGYGAGPAQIGRATSSDGITWTKSDAVALPKGPGGMTTSWDGSGVLEPHVRFDGTSYQMWYTGIGQGINIGYATSPDGITWTKATGPVLSGDGPGSGSWNEGGVSSPRVLFEGGMYKMWFQGHVGAVQQIGYATSPDGLVWTKRSTPVLSPVAGTFDTGIADLMVIRDGSGYRGWFTGVSGSSSRIGYATSTDGILWTLQPAGGPPEPVFDVGASGDWDDGAVYRPFILPDGGLLRMWYSGRRPGSIEPSIGLATSGT